jgi:hypothetical protein
MYLFSINKTNPYPENNERKMLKMVIHLSGRNAEVFGNTIQEKEPTNEIKKGILKIFIFDFTKPTIPVGNKIPFITKKRTIKFNGL